HAGFCLRQQQRTLENLLAIINPLNQDRSKLEQMSKLAKKTLIKNSSEQILDCVKKILNNN
ncbi:UDP-N-acetylglucosamine--N-acetylmuramyl-(pentapeptide) pyrophosphoryl-undecaprenol N-acetylglucosamine transferase, partial [Francisella tularensis subsp. holarctica]|nr:UDP-N-acetylglucosamine--N-acetylmuramyl-(pentapeptide) pyrophosphoryl-undecaprenol N-acetylglucosamine transferase [Francisella tularensis subsp. holarctica]